MEDAGQVDPGPVEVVRVEYHAASVDHAGRADADAEQWPVDSLAQLLRQAHGEADRILAAAGALERHLGAGFDMSE